MRLAWEFVSPMGYSVLLSHTHSSQLSYRREGNGPGHSLETGPQKRGHVNVHLAPEFLHIVFWQLNSPASALALPRSHSVLGRGSRDPSAALGRYSACFFFAVVQHCEPSLPPGCLPHPRCKPWTVSTDMAPIRALDLNFARSGCGDTMVAFGVFKHPDACAWPTWLPA